MLGSDVGWSTAIQYAIPSHTGLFGGDSARIWRHYQEVEATNFGSGPSCEVDNCLGHGGVREVDRPVRGVAGRRNRYADGVYRALVAALDQHGRAAGGRLRSPGGR